MAVTAAVIGTRTKDASSGDGNDGDSGAESPSDAVETADDDREATLEVGAPSPEAESSSLSELSHLSLLPLSSQSSSSD